MISSHLSLQPRSAFREAAKVHGLSNDQISRIIESSGEWILGSEEGLDPATQTGAEVPWLVPTSRSPLPAQFPLEAERWLRILADARLLFGRPHHLSIHPGGVVITPRPIADYVPLERAPKGIIITQFDKDGIERIGLVKIDLLGNRGLGTVEEATRLAMELQIANCKSQISNCRSPEQVSAGQFAIHNLQFAICNAAAASQVVPMLQKGDTLGITQLESPAMRHLLVQMQPASVDHVIQSLAMIRPAAASIGAKECYVRRRRGLEMVRYVHDCLESVLQETYGLMLYEDDALHVIQAMTRMSMIDADRFRKRVAKHRTEEEARRLAGEFLAACDRNGIPRPAAIEQWSQLPKFNRYSFCKSHAVSYGLIAWRAAHLKAQHPLAFWTAVLNNNQGMYPQRVYVEAIKRAGIRMLLPCVNRSADPFSIDGDAIRTGLDSIASLDEQLRTAILAERQRNGPYCDLADFCRRVAPGPEALAMLIRCGALDFTGKARPALFVEAELLGRDSFGRDDLFGRDPKVSAESWQPVDYSSERRLHDEWDILSFSVDVPLMATFRSRLPTGLINSGELPKHIGRRVRTAGLVATGRHAKTEDGRDMQFITLEDEYGLMDVTLFPGSCPLVPHLALGPYLVTGTVEEQYDVVTLTAERFERAFLK
jgi:DNA polymerase-3 subunit alpha/error-prone DNA polymerase